MQLKSLQSPTNFDFFFSPMAIPPLFLIIFSLFLSIYQSSSDPRATEAALICTNSTAALSDRNPFVPNFVAALDRLTPLVSRQKYGSAVVGSGNTTVYAYGECMEDLSTRDCDLCFAQCKTQILRCLPFQRLIRGGRLFYDGCYLRYDEYMFFNESLTSVERTVCGVQDFVGGDLGLFRRSVGELVRNLSGVAGRNDDGFAVGFVGIGRGNLSVYGLAQCWESVVKNGSGGCERCLAYSVERIMGCVPKVEGRVLNSGCYFRYSLDKFYDNSTDEGTSTGNGGSNHLAIALASTFGAVTFVLFVSAAAFYLRRRVLKQRIERKQLGALKATINKSKLNISYEALERATNYFHDSNKLGQGGSGSVYKGTLADGRNVAVKRLLFNTRQWVDHFFNEVNLISGIQHKNLVRLLGCSITGPESLLVYELVSNQSLHDHLFGEKKSQPLSWQQRYKIILGAAEGLAYLHEGSNLRIIHRDIKLSNILLDEDFMAKVADFGLARLFPEDKTHISTAIAGTLGYMAPEYVVRGKLTEKADVYSFGVLVIEVVCGQRNNSFTQNPSSIVQKVWSLYGTERICETVDPSMEGQWTQAEAARLLQIGLLCAQASAELRPSMSSVVKILSDSQEIPQPTQPPFLSGSSSEFAGLQNRPSHSSSHPDSHTHSSGNSMTQSLIEPR